MSDAIQGKAPARIVVSKDDPHAVIAVKTPSRLVIIARGSQVGAALSSSVAVSQADVVLGRDSSGPGGAMELPCTAFARSLLGAASSTAARVVLGLVLGTNVQAYSAELDGAAAITGTGYVKHTAPGAWATAASVPWADLSNVPTTVAGYGITDVYNKSQVDALLAGYEPLDPDLAAIAALGTTGYLKRTAANTWALSAGLPWADVTGSPTTATGYGIASIDSVPIGPTTASTGRFTSLSFGSQGINTQAGIIGTLAGLTSASGSVFGVRILGAADSNSTGNIKGVSSEVTTAAAAYTATAITHFDASGAALGAGSAVGTVRGFYARNGMAVGSTNQGIYSDINAATNTWAFYGAGTAQSYFAGAVAIGTSNTAGDALLRFAGASASGSSTLYTIFGSVSPPSTNTSVYAGYYSAVTTAAAAYTLGEIRHFAANTTNLGAGSAVTTVRGFYAVNAIAVGTNNYGFYSDLAAASGATYAFYAAGTAPSVMGSELYIGRSTPVGGGEMVSISMTNQALSGNGAGFDKIGISIRGNAAASVVSNVIGIQTFALGSNASAITLGNLTHFYAQNSSLGAGSTITAAYGFRVANAIAVGTTNYGFYSDINSSAATNWAIHCVGTAPSYFRGRIGINVSSTTDDPNSIFRVAGTHTSTAVSAQATSFDVTAPSTMTTSLVGMTVLLRSTAAAFTIGEVNFFKTQQFILGAASAVTLMKGFYASSTIAVGTTNYGFYSDINDATTTWQSYMAGTAQSYFGGPVGVLSNNPLSQGYALLVGGAGVVHPATVTSVTGVKADLTAASTATAANIAFMGVVRTAASAFTCATVECFRADTIVLGAGSTITTARGFYARNAIAVGTNNYGFYSDISSATGTFQSYMGGTGSSYFGGPVQIGAGSNDATNLNAAFVLLGNAGAHPSSAVTVYGVRMDYTAPSTATTQARGVSVQLRSAAAAFTLPLLIHFHAAATVVGAGSAITVIKAFWADNNAVNATAGCTSYGFHTDFSVPAAGTAFAFYGAGTADSSFGGGVLCRSASSGIGYATGAGGTVTQATSKATGVALSKNSGQITMNAAALAAATIVSFVVTNTSVAATDVIELQHQSGGTLGAYGLNASCAAGSFTVYVRNNTAGSLSEALVLSFVVIKGVTA